MWSTPDWEGEDTLTTKQLTALTVEWKRRLRLMDWEVVVRFSPEKEVEGDGKTLYHKQLKIANIQICDEGTFVGGCGVQEYDAEQILVHELLHLHFPGFEDGAPGHANHDKFETAIDLIAWGLVRAKRGV